MLRAARLAILPVSFAHGVEAGRLPEPHRDPWDRILTAQAQAERLAVVTVDPGYRQDERDWRAGWRARRS